MAFVISLSGNFTQSFSRPNMISILLRCLLRRLSCLMGLPRDFRVRDAGLYPFVIQRISEPVGIMAAVGQQLIRLWQAVQKRSRSRIIADLAWGHAEADRAAIGVCDGLQFGVHAAVRATDQTTPLFARPPIFDRRLVAVR
jgi:hypothetical protein